MAHLLSALGSGVLVTPNSSDAAFSACLFYAIDVNSAVPSTPYPFSFPLKSAKLKEEAGFAETRKPLSSRPELLFLGDLTSQSRESTVRMGSGETAAWFNQQLVQPHFPL